VSWQTFIETARPGEHAVHVFRDGAELGRAVGTYITKGFDAGAPAVVIATPGHRRRIAQELEARGGDAAVLERRGLLTHRDAEDTLAQFMDGGVPVAGRFERVIGGLLDEVAGRFPDRTIRAFGEMVDLLWSRGERKAASALEALWNQLAESRRFALLCGYHVDIFDAEVQRQALPEIFGPHTHMRPASDPARLAAAVDYALAETAGPSGAARVYLEVAEEMPSGGWPRAQALLNWVSRSRPGLAANLLEQARSRYVGLRASDGAGSRAIERPSP
jgi:MEDS: MEthanogen/methylotroph, DcmR Sensory domain